MPANLENSAVATGLEKVSFLPMPKKGNFKECSNYCTNVLISHTTKVMPQILQVRLQQYVNHELPDVQLFLEKAEQPEIKLPTSNGSSKKQESSRKTSTSVLLTMPKPLTVWITINCGISWKMMLWKCCTQHASKLDHGKRKRVLEKHLFLLYWLCQSLWLCGSQETVENSERDGNTRPPDCLLRNLYAGQEATVRTGHGTTDWFQIEKRSTYKQNKAGVTGRG